MTLADPKAFYDTVRAAKLFGATLDQSELTGCEAVLKACVGLPVSWTAYAAGTAYHETAHTMLPIKEFGGQAYFFRMYDPQGNNPALAARLGNTEPGDGAKFAGRGYVQLTGRRNYLNAEKRLGVPFSTNPALALNPDKAAMIMRRGMEEGWFTGKNFAAYLSPQGPAALADFFRARRIINGTDRAEMIAEYALTFQKALLAGKWV